MLSLVKAPFEGQRNIFTSSNVMVMNKPSMHCNTSLSGGRFVTSKTPANTILITLEEGGNKIGSLEYKEVDTTIPAK